MGHKAYTGNISIIFHFETQELLIIFHLFGIIYLKWNIIKDIRKFCAIVPDLHKDVFFYNINIERGCMYENSDYGF